MKKIITISLITISLSSNAFFNNIDNNWGATNGYQQDNGFFGYNPYELYDPRWYMEEMTNVMDTFDNNTISNNKYAYGSSKDFPALDTSSN